MASSKLIIVVGATGQQGGSVIETFLSQPGWRVRGLTRDPSSSKAQDLASRGVEIVQADLRLPETLLTAFSDADAIFAMTNFWDLYRPENASKVRPGQPLNQWVGEQETHQLKNVIDAAAKVPTLQRFILSSLSNATKWSKGKYVHAYHFDSKANAVEYGRETYPELWSKTSILQAGFFLSNYVSNPRAQPRKNKSGNVSFISGLDPTVKIPLFAPEEDTGPFVHALTSEPAGKNVICYRQWMNSLELAQAFTEVTGIKADVVQLAKGESGGNIPPELKLEFDDMVDYMNEFGYEARDDPSLVHPTDLATTISLGSVTDYFRKQDWTAILGST